MASLPKKARTEDDVSDGGPEIDHAVLESVDSVQEAIDSLNKKASVEILKVEQKYNKLRKPHYEHRAELLAKIPVFWKTAFINHRHMRKIVTEEDKKVLAFLRAVEVQEFDDITSGYKINFYFDENEWFTNDCITREYRVAESGDPIVTATKINWKPNMSLFDSSDNGKEEDNEYLSRSGFFSWFAFERNAVGDIIGDYVKDELWPNPLQYYLNPEPDSEDEEVEEDILDEEEEDEEDEEEEDEEDGQEVYDEVGGDEPAKQ